MSAFYTDEQMLGLSTETAELIQLWLLHDDPAYRREVLECVRRIASDRQTRQGFGQ